MLPANLNKTHSATLLLFVAIFAVLPAYAQQTTVSVVNAQTMIQNISSQIPALMQLVTATAYVMGMYFIFAGVFKLKQYGEQRTMMSGEHHLKGPIIFISVGAMLLYLPSAVQVGMSTFWTNPNPYGYLPSGTDQWSQFMNDVFMLMQLFGVIAFIRGLLLLSHLGGQGGQPGTFAKAVTQIIAGIFCINLYQFVQVIMVTLGVST